MLTHIALPTEQQTEQPIDLPTELSAQQEAPPDIKFAQDFRVEADVFQPVVYQAEIDLKEVRSIKKQVAMSALSRETKKLQAEFTKIFDESFAALQPADTKEGGVFSPYCTNQKFKQLLYERLLLIKKPYDDEFTRIKARVDSMPALWKQLLDEEKTRAAEKIKEEQLQLQELLNVKWGFLQLLQCMALTRFSDMQQEVLQNPDKKDDYYRVFASEFGSIISLTDMGVKLDRGHGVHAKHSDDFLNYDKINLDESWIRSTTILELIDLANKIIMECLVSAHFILVFESEILKLIKKNQAYYSYDPKQQRIHVAPEQWESIATYPALVRETENNLAKNCRVDNHGAKMKGIKREVVSDLKKLTDDLPTLKIKYDTAMAAAAVAFAQEIDDAFQRVVTELKPTPDITEFKTTIAQLAALLTEITAIYKELPEKAELGDVDRVIELERQAYLKWELAHTLTIAILRIQDTLRKKFVEVKVALRAGNDKLIKLNTQYEAQERSQQILSALTLRITEFHSQKTQKKKLQDQYQGYLEQYDRMRAAPPDYPALTARARVVKAELDFVNISKQIRDHLATVAREAKEIKPVLTSVRNLPPQWEKTVAQLQEKAQLGLSRDLSFTAAETIVKDFADEEAKKQDDIEGCRERILRSLRAANELHKALAEKYTSIDKSMELLALGGEIAQAWTTIEGVPLSENPRVIEGRLSHIIDEQQRLARQNQKINARRERRKGQLHQRFLQLIGNLNYWKDKFTKKYYTRTSYVGGLQPENTTVRVSDSVAMLYKVFQTTTDTNERLKELKKTAQERKRLPTKNCYYRVKYYFFARDVAVTQLLDALCKMNLQEPNCEEVEALLPQVVPARRPRG